MKPTTGELNRLAHQKYGRMYGALTKEEQRSLIPSEPGYDRLLTSEEESIMSEAQEPKHQKINRMDPLWTAIAAVAIQASIANSVLYTYQRICDFADAMLRERDRRDGEERE